MTGRRTKILEEFTSNAVVFYNGVMVNNVGTGFYSQNELNMAEALNKTDKGYLNFGHYTVLVGGIRDGNRMVILLDQSGLDMLSVYKSYGTGSLKNSKEIGLVMGYPVIGEVFIHRLFPLFTTNMTEYIRYMKSLANDSTGKIVVNHLVLDKDKYVDTSAYFNSHYTELIPQSANIHHGRFCKCYHLTDIPVKAKWINQIEKESIEDVPMVYTEEDVINRVYSLAKRDGVDLIRMSNVIEEQIRRNTL